MDSNSLFEQAIWFEDHFHLSVLRKIRKTSYWIFLGVFTAFLVVFLVELLSVSAAQKLLGISFLLFSYTALLFLFEAFGKSLQKGNTEVSFEVAKIFAHAKPTSRDILLTFLKSHKALDFIFQRALLDKKSLIQILKKDSSSHVLPKEVQPKTIPDLLYALAEHNPLFEEFLTQHNLKPKDMYNLASWQWRIKKEKESFLSICIRDFLSRSAL